MRIHCLIENHWNCRCIWFTSTMIILHVLLFFLFYDFEWDLLNWPNGLARLMLFNCWKWFPWQWMCQSNSFPSIFATILYWIIRSKSNPLKTASFICRLVCCSPLKIKKIVNLGMRNQLNSDPRITQENKLRIVVKLNLISIICWHMLLSHLISSVQGLFL